jgi:phenylalanine-4-hydroxylase
MKTINNITSPLSDREFSTRQSHIITQATGATATPNTVTYLPRENKVWQIVSTTLRPIWDTKVADAVLEAREAIQLPINTVPQLSEVSAKLRPLSGFAYHSVGGLVPVEDFFGALANRSFLSTQYLRHPKSPLYTPEPDIIHEVIGHGTCLANERLATLHQLAGEALIRVTTKQARQFIADVWWFTGEFGVVRHSKDVKAYGAGILSSAGELEAFTKASIRPLHIGEMGTTSYRIDQMQPTLFAAESIEHLMETVGSFFATVDDTMIEEILRARRSPRRTK